MTGTLLSGAPTNAFIVCTFWYIDALTVLGRRDEARALFDATLARRNRLGLFSEHIDTRTGELWGNFPQTYSMVGMINSATRLPWTLPEPQAENPVASLRVLLGSAFSPV